MRVWPAYLPMHHMHAWCPWRPQEGLSFPETGFTEGCEQPGCWEFNPDPLEEQPILLIPNHLSSPSISLAEGEAPESGNKDSCGTGNHVSGGFLLLWVVGVFRDPQTMLFLKRKPTSLEVLLWVLRFPFASLTAENFPSPRRVKWLGSTESLLGPP